MSVDNNRSTPTLHSDLSEKWLRDQKARISQRHLQFGRRLRLDVDSLLSRAALLSRVKASRRVPRQDFMRRATVDAIEHCLRLDAAISTAFLKPNVA